MGILQTNQGALSCDSTPWQSPFPSDPDVPNMLRRDPPGAEPGPAPGHKNSAAKRPLEWPTQSTTWPSESTCLYPGGWIVLASRNPARNGAWRNAWYYPLGRPHGPPDRRGRLVTKLP